MTNTGELSLAAKQGAVIIQNKKNDIKQINNLIPSATKKRNIKI